MAVFAISLTAAVNLSLPGCYSRKEDMGDKGEQCLERQLRPRPPGVPPPVTELLASAVEVLLFGELYEDCSDDMFYCRKYTLINKHTIKHSENYFGRLQFT